MLMDLGTYIPAAHIIAPLRAENDDEALNRLVTKVVEHTNKFSTTSKILEQLRTESVLRAALVGHGTAIIHSRIEDLPESVTTLGIAPPETSFRIGNSFRYLVSVIFLVLSPTEPPEPHLELVAAIANFVRDTELLSALKSSRSAEEATNTLARK